MIVNIFSVLVLIHLPVGKAGFLCGNTTDIPDICKVGTTKLSNSVPKKKFCVSFTLFNFDLLTWKIIRAPLMAGAL
jgi:hypothetical protein